VREFILNRLNMIYYIYIFVELTITLNLLTMKEFTFLFFFSVLLIVMFFSTIFVFTKNISESQIYYNFLTNTMLFFLSLQYLGVGIKIFSTPIITALFFYFVYLKYNDEKNKTRSSPP
jgi:hypothetical protein